MFFCLFVFVFVIVVWLVLTFNALLPVGAILKLPFLGQASDKNCFDDSIYWEVRYKALSKGSLFSLCWKRYSTLRFAQASFQKCCPALGHEFIKSTFMIYSGLATWSCLLHGTNLEQKAESQTTNWDLSEALYPSFNRLLCPVSSSLL